MSLLVPLQLTCLIALAVLLVAAARQDLRTMRIADSFSLAIAGLFVIWALSGLGAGTLSLTAAGLAVGCAMALFALGVVAFALGALGGGDVKLLAATALFAGPGLLPDLLMVTAVAGGVLGLATLAGARLGPATATADGSISARLREGLPYGPAIAAGGLWVAAVQAAS